MTDSNIQPSARRTARGLSQRVLARFRRLGLSGEPLIAVGFSGGVDSLCLAATLGHLRRSGKLRVHLIHVDHGLRNESADDAERARALANELGLPITIHRLEPGLSTRASGVGVEGAARRERYAAFEAACLKIGAELLALGHHQRDQAETVLLHLLRGSGLAGAAAMSEVTEFDHSLGPRIWRPFLAEPRSTIEGALEEAALSPIHDRSNDDQGFLRNWLRSELLPALEARNPGATSSLARFAEIAAEEDRLLAAIAAERLHRSTDEDGRLNWMMVEAEPLPVKRRVLRTWLDFSLAESEVSFERVEAVRGLAQRQNPEVMVQLGGGRIVFWDDGRLVATSTSDAQATLGSKFNGPFASPSFRPRRLQSGAPLEFDGWRLTGWGSGAVELRRVAQGDRMAGSGRPIRELARAGGVHPLLRRKLIVAASADGPIWVAGLPFAESGWRFELTKVEGNR